MWLLAGAQTSMTAAVRSRTWEIYQTLGYAQVACGCLSVLLCYLDDYSIEFAPSEGFHHTWILVGASPSNSDLVVRDIRRRMRRCGSRCHVFQNLKY